MLRVQRYVSDELTHFVGRSMRGDLEAQYGLFLKIVQEGWLTHPPHQPGISGNLSVEPDAKISENQMYVPQMVCFCDIPVEDLGLHSSKYGRFGLAFKRSFLAALGANPVFYVAKYSVVWVPRETGEIDLTNIQAINIRDRVMKRVTRAAHFDLMAQAHHREFETQMRHASGQEDAFEKISKASRVHRFIAFHLFAYLKCFDETKPDDDPDNFYMEREWRVLGNVQFSLEDVSRVILPEEFARRFRVDVPDYYKQVTFI